MGIASFALAVRIMQSAKSHRITYSVGGLNERVVDSNDLDVGVLDSVAEDDATDTAKSVDADLDHFEC